MAARRSPIGPILALALVVGGGWVASSPFRAYADLESAARAGDQQALEELVDFPAFRESAKAEVRGSVERGLAGDGDPNLAGRIGGMLAGAMAAPVVDHVVTPGGIAALTQGFRPGETRKGRDTPNDASAEQESRFRVSRGYEDLSTFAIRFRDRETGRERVTLLLHRDGLRWRLAEMRLGVPVDAEDEQ